MADSQNDPVLTPEDIEFLIAYLRTTAEPVSTSALIELLRSRDI